MQVVTGTVIGGKVVVEGVELPEGAVVTVLSRGADESLTLTGEQEADLLEAVAEIADGNFLTLEELMSSLPKPAGA